MGTFNTIFLPFSNPLTKEEMTLRIQYKWGACRCYDVHVGDTIHWGYNEHGIPGIRRVMIGGDCEQEGPGIPELWEVYITEDRIEKVIPDTGRYNLNWYPVDLDSGRDIEEWGK